MLYSLLPIASLLALVSAADNPYATYPLVAKTASINGFADRIYDQLPSCAQPCVRKSTSSTPCPYWDTGCLCVMTNWASDIADCIAQNCQGTDVTGASSLAVSLCSAAGVWEPYWIIDSSASLSLAAAAAVVAETTSDAAPATSEAAPATSEEAPATTEAATSEAPVTTEAATSEAAPAASSEAAAPAASSEAAPAPAASSEAAAPAASSEAAPAAASSAVPEVTSANGAGAAAVAGVAGVAAGLAMLL